MKESLFSLIRTQEHRLLDMLGRDKCSTDYGRFAPREELLAQPALQCLLLPLARLVSDRTFSSPLYGEEIPVNWARAALLTLHDIQQPGGGFGKRPGHDWTGLLLYQAILAFRRIGRCMDDAEKTVLDMVLLQAGRFVARHCPRSSLRQLESALALLELFRLTGNREFETCSQKKLQILLSQQQPGGFFPEPDGFDARQHFIATELISRCHFLQKSDLTRALLKASLPLLYHLQRPDGTIENEMFEHEDFLTLPGYLLHLRRELPESEDFLDRLTAGAMRDGQRILPWQHRLEFATSGYRLFSTIELFFGENAQSLNPVSEHKNTHEIQHLSSLGLTTMITPRFKIFIHPTAHRVKIFSRLSKSGELIYADSGYRLEQNGITWLPEVQKQNVVCEVTDTRIAFPFTLAPTTRQLFRRRPVLHCFREIIFERNIPRFITKFFFGQQDPGHFRLARIYSRRSRIFRPEEVRIPSFEDLPCPWRPVSGEAVVTERLMLDSGRWLLKSDAEKTIPA